MSKEKVQHHGFAQLILMIILFIISLLLFGGWAEGPLLSGLFVGFHVYQLVAQGATGNLDAVSAAGMDVLSLAIIFLINLAIYYVISAILIFLFNLLFGGKKKE